MGILYAILAIGGWGLGDFLIQRSARKFGDWEALFFITFFATIVLLPFVYSTLQAYTAFEWFILILTSVVIFVAALFDFDALRVGKISIIEPIYAMEVPVTVALATFVLNEGVRPVQLMLILGVLLGIFLVSTKHFQRTRVRSLERGVWYAILATVGMGASNFLFGFDSRVTSPLMVNWFTSAFIAVATLLYLMWVGQTHRIWVHLKRNSTLILLVSCADNLAWVAYSWSMLYLPISIATGLTESYIALAALLGLTINREKLRGHQIAGLILAVASAVVLALSAENL